LSEHGRCRDERDEKDSEDQFVAEIGAGHTGLQLTT
jgi:hypothetical protein